MAVVSYIMVFVYVYDVYLWIVPVDFVRLGAGRIQISIAPHQFVEQLSGRVHHDGAGCSFITG